MKRCVYCGHLLSRGGRIACGYHRELAWQEGLYGERPRRQPRGGAPHFAAFCGKCGTITVGKWDCADCGSPLYLQTTKGTGS